MLLLALAIERRIFHVGWPAAYEPRGNEPRLAYIRRRITFDTSDFIRATVMIVTLTMLVAGEVRALEAFDDPSQGDAKAVWMAVSVGLVLIAYLALFGGTGQDRDWKAEGADRSE